jgi:Leucine-rich repeat (LRR) protein
VEAFLTRTLTTDGSLQTAGTPQNNALLSMTETFPMLDPSAGAEEQNLISSIYALEVIYFSTSGDNWRDRTNWLGPTPPCGDETGASGTWFGVACDADLFVTDIELPENDLFGELTSEIKALTKLQNLLVQRNSIFGEIPAEIGNLTDLLSLDYDENFLNGTLPTTIGQLTNLLNLTMSMNTQVGPIPTELGNLINLINLDMQSNEFTGTIPPTFAGLQAARK